MRRFLPILLGFGLAVPASADGLSMLPGPIPAELVTVIDGDTVRVRAQVWLDTWIETAVRIRGIDAPELHGRCAEERRRAEAARDRLVEIVTGRGLALLEVSADKYGGRVDAVLTADGAPVADKLLEEGLVRVYAGGEREPWC